MAYKRKTTVKGSKSDKKNVKTAKTTVSAKKDNTTKPKSNEVKTVVTKETTDLYMPSTTVRDRVIENSGFDLYVESCRRKIAILGYNDFSDMLFSDKNNALNAAKKLAERDGKDISCATVLCVVKTGSELKLKES